MTAAPRADLPDTAPHVLVVDDDRRLRELLADPAVTGVITDEPAIATEVRHEVTAAAHRQPDALRAASRVMTG